MSLSLLSQLNRSRLWQQPLRMWNLTLQPSTLDRRLALMAHQYGILGKGETEFLRKVLTPNSVVVDVGANQGLYSMFCSQIARLGEIYALEPDPELFSCLTRNVERNQLKNIHPIQRAASDRQSELFLMVGALNRGDNRVHRERPVGKTFEIVASAPLDDLITANRVDLLKVDVQGWEIPVLTGARHLLNENHNLVVLCEFWPFGLRLAGFEPEQLIENLSKHGFTLLQLQESGACRALEPGILRWKRRQQYTNLVAHRGHFELSVGPKTSKN
jgi:FkbM family methyltransferase